MGRGRKPKTKQASTLTTTRKNVVVLEPVIKTSTTRTVPGGGFGGSGDAGEKKKTIKLVDVVKAVLPRIYSGQNISVVDSDVYAGGTLVGRVPEKEGITTGIGKIQKVDPDSGEVWIRI